MSASPNIPPLPRWAHRPGLTEGPDREPLEDVKRLVPARLDPGALGGHGAFRYGLTLHDAAFFWEAHEVLEAVWKALPPNGRERRIVRAVIQLANAELKLRIGRRRAALRLFEETLALLNEAARTRPPGEDGRAVRQAAPEDLIAAVRRRRDAVVAGAEGGPPIQLSSLS